MGDAGDALFGLRQGRLRRHHLVDAGGDDGDADDAVEALVEGGADDDVGVLVRLLSNASGGFLDLE